MDLENRLKFQKKIFRQVLWIMIIAAVSNVIGNLMTDYPMNANIKWVIVVAVAGLILKKAMNSRYIVSIMYVLLTLLILLILPMGWYNSGKVNNNALAYVFLFVIGVVILFNGWRRYSLLGLILVLFGVFMYVEFRYPDFLPVYDGLLAFWDKLIQVPLTILIAAAMMIQYADAFNKKNKELGDLSDKFRKLAYMDVLTGLGNRAFIIKELERLVAEQKDFITLMIDLDNFKYVNDQYGHLQGDQVLRALAGSLKRTFGEESLFGRYGGDEFIILFREQEETLEDRILHLMEDIHENTKISAVGATISGGYGRYSFGQSLDSHLRQIDQTLYRAKGSGKDQILRAGVCTEMPKVNEMSKYRAMKEEM